MVLVGVFRSLSIICSYREKEREARVPDRGSLCGSKV